jgi:hypothetical protein
MSNQLIREITPRLHQPRRWLLQQPIVDVSAIATVFATLEQHVYFRRIEQGRPNLFTLERRYN